MAAASDKLLLEVVTQQLQRSKCAVCENIDDVQPKLLLCSHSVCNRCCSRNSNAIECRWCHQETVHKDIRSNVLRRHVGIMSALLDPKRCSTCDQHVASHVCLTCEGSSGMCDGCLKEHKRHTKRTPHQVISLFDLETKGRGHLDQVYRMKHDMRCQDHNYDVLTDYCLECGKSTCKTCLKVNGGHKGHSVVPLHSWGESRRQTVVEQVEQIESLSDEVLSARVEEIEESLSISEAEEEVMINTIKEQSQKLQEAVRRGVGEQRKLDRDILARLRHFPVCIEDTKSFAMTSTKLLPDVDLSDNTPYLIKQLAKLSHQVTTLQSPLPYKNASAMQTIKELVNTTCKQMNDVIELIDQGKKSETPCYGVTLSKEATGHSDHGKPSSYGNGANPTVKVSSTVNINVIPTCGRDTDDRSNCEKLVRKKKQLKMYVTKVYSGGENGGDKETSFNDQNEGNVALNPTSAKGSTSKSQKQRSRDVKGPGILSGTPVETAVVPQGTRKPVPLPGGIAGAVEDALQHEGPIALKRVKEVFLKDLRVITGIAITVHNGVLVLGQTDKNLEKFSEVDATSRIEQFDTEGKFTQSIPLLYKDATDIKYRRGEVYVADCKNRKVFKVDRSGRTYNGVTSWTHLGVASLPGSEKGLDTDPSGNLTFAFAASGDIVVGSRATGRLYRQPRNSDAGHTTCTELGNVPVGTKPFQICFTPDDDLVLADFDNQVVTVCSMSTLRVKSQYHFGKDRGADFVRSLAPKWGSAGVTCDSASHIFVSDYDNDRVTALSSDCKVMGHLSVKKPRYVAISPDGEYLAVARANNIVELYCVSGGSCVVL